MRDLLQSFRAYPDFCLLLDSDSDENRDVLDFAAPAAFQIHTIYVDIGVLAGKWTAMPFFDVLVNRLPSIPTISTGKRMKIDLLPKI